MTEYLIATSVLESIVRGAVADDERLRVHARVPFVGGDPMEITVDEGTCRVVVQLDARMGEVLPSLASETRGKIAAALNQMTGLAVSGVDIVFSGVFPSGE